MTIPEVVENGAGQAFSVVAQTLLGAVAILAVGVAILAVWKLVALQEKYTARQEKQAEKVAELAVKMTETFSAVDKTLAELTTAERDSQQQNRDSLALLQQMKNSIDTIIRDAVMASRYGRGRSMTPPGTPMPPSGDRG